MNPQRSINHKAENGLEASKVSSSGNEGELAPAPSSKPTESGNAASSNAAPGIDQSNSVTLRDLAAQEIMADAAIWMAIAAFLTFAITTLGTFLIWRQVSLTRKAVEDTSRATSLMQHDQRAWLDIDLTFEFCSTRSKGDWIVSCKLEISNIGRSPSTNVRWEHVVFDDLGRSKDWINETFSSGNQWRIERRPHSTDIAILPNGSIKEQEFIFVNDDTIPLLRLGGAIAHVYMVVDYETAGGLFGRTVCGFYIGPKSDDASFPDAFDPENGEHIRDIIIHKVGTTVCL